MAKKQKKSHLQKSRARFKAGTVSSGGVSSLFGSRNSIKASGPWDAFYQNEWVYAAVTARAAAFAGLTIKLVNQKGEEQTDNPAMQLLLNPNDLQTRYELMESISVSMSLFGIAYLWINDTKSSNTELVLLDSSNVTVTTTSGVITSYRCNNVVIQPENMVVFRETGRSPYDVISAVKASLGSFHMDQFAKIWNERFFMNGGSPATIIKLDKELGEEEFSQILANFEEHLLGMKNQGRTTVIAEDFEVVKVSESPKDIDFKSLTEAVMQRILATLRVPKTMIGLTEQVNRASAEAAEYTFQKNVNKPSAERFVEKLNQEYIPKLRAVLTGVGKTTLVGVAFVFDDPVPQDNELRLKQWDLLSKYGVWTINENRTANGLPPIEGGDVLIQRAGAGPVTTETPEVPEEEVEERSFHGFLKKKGVKNIKTFRDRYYKLVPKIGNAFVKRFESEEVKVRKDMITLFNTQERGVLKNLTKEFNKALTESEIDDVLFDVDKEAERFWKKMGPVFLGIMDKEGVIATNEVVPGLGDTFDIQVPSTAQALRAQKQRFAEPVNDTTWDRLRKTLADGVENGEGINKLKKRVNSVYMAAREHRSISIARTETLTAANSGRDIAFDELGVEEKIWLTANDGRVRETHASADGQVSKDGEFNVGGESALYPGDASLSAEEAINCRCTIVAQI